MDITPLETGLAALFGRHSETWQPNDPLAELIECILNQRTTHGHALRAAVNLRAACQSWADVAALPHDTLVDLVRPAGLAKSKAACIHGILAQLYRDFGAYSLASLTTMDNRAATKYLVGLPGVGPHTAALVLVFAMGRPGVMPVDGHIHRVARRLGFTAADASALAVQQAIERGAPEANLMDLHVNLIRLGHRHCTAGTPDCLECPVSDLCRSARLQPQWEVDQL